MAAVRFSGSAVRDLESIPPRYAAAVLEFIFGALSDNPARVGKPLERELAGTPSARRGDYRVIYEIRPGSNEVLVIRIDHRAHIYRAR